jgi:hypothetical protein
MFMKSPLLLGLLLLAPGCRQEAGKKAPQREGGLESPDATMASLPDARGADAGVAVADVPAAAADLRSAAERAFLEFLEAYNAGFRQRLVGCFNFSATVIARDVHREATPSMLTSLRLGLSGWDAAQAARCLDQLATAPCLDIASGRALVACGKVITGRVADDDFCVDDVDCRQPGRVCGLGGIGQCAGVCQRRLTGTAPAGEGAACVADEGCLTGLYCRTAAGSDGTCRPIVPGEACQHPAECPWPYTCVAGSYQIDRAAGELCQQIDTVESDCVYTATCKPIGSQMACVSDQPHGPPPVPREIPLGGKCGDTDDPCILGTFCLIDPAMLMQEPPPPRLIGICLPWRNAGEPCSPAESCRPGSECLQGRCAACPSGTAPDAGAADLPPPTGDASCGANLKSDPASCGACGRSCQGATCREGFCLPRALGSGIDGEPEGLAVDDSGVYITESALYGRVLRVTTDGSAPLKVLAPLQPQPAGLAIDATHVYWVNLSGVVSRVPKLGGAVEVLAMGEAQPRLVAVDDANVYWTIDGRPDPPGVRRMPKAGGTPELFAAAESPGGIALDASYAYWADGTGTISRRAKGGGPVQVLAAGEQGAHRIALDATRVYFTADEHIGSVPKVGGPVTIVSPTFNAQDVATDGEGGVYWTTNTEIERWRQGPLRLVDGIFPHELEVRGPWVYYVTGSSLLRVAK